MEEQKSFYVDQSKMYFEFLISCGQWSGISKIQMQKWFCNFSDIPDGEYIACKLLSHLLAYSEKDQYKLICGAINEIFVKECVVQLQLRREFSLIKSEIQYLVEQEIGKTLFIPLLSDGVPGESGETILRLLTQKFKPNVQRLHSYNIVDNMPYTRLIIVDDCIGSGQQFSTFWEESVIKNQTFLRHWVKQNDIKAYYVVLVGYENSISELTEKFGDIEIICAEKLNDEHKIFSDGSYCWNDLCENHEVQKVLNPVLKQNGISLKGHSDLDFAVLMHNTIPDWSLPLFYKQIGDWKLLMERKNSYA